MMHDPLNAICRHTHVALAGSGSGPLTGLTFAAKDVFDIAGHRTGNGNPVWLETHPPAERTASAVQRLLDAGARMVGKTHTDDMAYSLNGENVHYGTPVNPVAPGRIPGGSSSGSVAAVAGGLVDFALGTDCGGSVRLPASYCGVYGLRPTHGLVPADGVVPLAPSFDTVGWFARDAALMRRIGEVLLPRARAGHRRGFWSRGKRSPPQVRW
jgi:amidase